MGKNAMRGGAYSAVITAVVLAILVVVNICLSVLPQARRSTTSAQASSIPSPATQRACSTPFPTT